MKMLEVEDNTHLQTKAQAKERGMTIRGYIAYIVKKDKQLLMRGK